MVYSSDYRVKWDQSARSASERQEYTGRQSAFYLDLQVHKGLVSWYISVHCRVGIVCRTLTMWFFVIVWKGLIARLYRIYEEWKPSWSDAVASVYNRFTRFPLTAQCPSSLKHTFMSHLRMKLSTVPLFSLMSGRRTFGISAPILYWLWHRWRLP